MGAVGTAMAANPIGAAFAIGGAILGRIGMKKKRREEARRRERERKHALVAQRQLVGSIDAIRAEYAERAGFRREGYDLQQSQGLLNYGMDRQQADSSIGQSNLAYGGANKAREQLDMSFQNEYKGRQLEYKEGFSALERSYESDLRGVQTGLLNLQATAAQRGYKIPGVSVNTESNIGGLS